MEVRQFVEISNYKSSRALGTCKPLLWSCLSTEAGTLKLMKEAAKWQQRQLITTVRYTISLLISS